MICRNIGKKENSSAPYIQKRIIIQEELKALGTINKGQ
jgi:hypothetical protein